MDMSVCGTLRWTYERNTHSNMPLSRCDTHIEVKTLIRNGSGARTTNTSGMADIIYASFHRHIFEKMFYKHKTFPSRAHKDEMLHPNIFSQVFLIAICNVTIDRSITMIFLQNDTLVRIQIINCEIYTLPQLYLFSSDPSSQSLLPSHNLSSDRLTCVRFDRQIKPGTEMEMFFISL